MQPGLPFDVYDAPVFVRHPKARRYLIRVRDDGSVRVTMPRWGSKREAQAFAERERAWIDAQRRRVEQGRLRAAGPQLVDGRPLTPDFERELRARAKGDLPARLRELAA